VVPAFIWLLLAPDEKAGLASLLRRFARRAQQPAVLP
jgi:hypothetical protein